MNFKKSKPLARGLLATAAALLTLTIVGSNVAKSDLCIGWVDGFTKTDRNIYNDWTETIPAYTIPGSFEGYSYLKAKNFTKDHENVKAYAEALKQHAVKQGEEGFTLLKNDNDALPLKKSTAGKKVALFGWNAYHVPTAHTGVVAGNITGTVQSAWGGPQTYNSYINQISLADAFNAMSEVEVNATVTNEHFTGAMTSPTNKAPGAGFGGSELAWSDITYTIPETKPTDEQVATWNIDKATTTGVVVLGRGGGEGNNFKVDACTNAEDPLALCQDELDIIKLAKEKCAKVVVLIVTANAMELGPLVQKGGQYEVDSIGYCGIPNDYQYEGIANVLQGKVNASGHLNDTFVYDNTYTPASINMGEQKYSDVETIENFTDPLGRGITSASGNGSYFADHYIVEQEGIYVGYKYYETRYFDGIVNPETSKANSKVGSSQKDAAWNYANEVLYTFGEGLSYIPYSQTLKSVRVDKTENGKITAEVEVKNEGSEEGLFTAQLYVNKPYTQYDITNKVEKSAVDFLNSKKVSLKAGESKTVEIKLPTRYLASWDSKALNGAGTYILDDGDYYFTVGNGAHAAVNNVLAAQGKTTDGKTTASSAIKWNLEAFDSTTYSNSNGVEVRNQMENADINYFYGEEKVKYLSRSDWEGTFPKNYTSYANSSGIQPEAPFEIKNAKKAQEWLTELISAQYKVTPSTDSSKWYEVAGTKPASLKADQTVWQWIMEFATSKPEAFANIHSEEWQAVAKAIDLDEAVAAVKESGGSSRTFPSIGNPVSKQSESVSGYSQKLTVEGEKTMVLNVASNTLLGASFDPDLAHEWGLLEGEGGLWLQAQDGSPAITVWGAGLTQHRHAYNGRNSEYVSEDPMLANRIGEAQLRGAVSKGAICGPKHMGFNDQERGREGVACYMTEQKVRECDTRCFEGSMRVEEGNGTGVMMSFARIGATNVTNSIGYMKNIIRGEWGFTGIVTTDMGKGAGYHEVGALTMATVNEYAGFGSSTLYGMVDGKKTDDAIFDTAFSYITLGDARKDPVYAEQCRQTSLYLLYTLARSGSGLNVERVENMGQDIQVPETTIDHHDPVGTIKTAGWQKVCIGVDVFFGLAAALAGAAWVAGVVKGIKED